MNLDLKNRTSSGQFLPGKSGNPGGRPKDEHRVAELARSYTAEAIETLVDLMRHGKDERVRGTAAQALLDRGRAEEAGIKGEILSDLPITAVIKSKDKSKSDMMVVTYYPMFVTEQTKEWPEKKLCNQQWVPLDEIDHHLKKGYLRKVVKTFRVLLPFIRAGAVKSKWTKGW